MNLEGRLTGTGVLLASLILATTMAGCTLFGHSPLAGDTRIPASGVPSNVGSGTVAAPRVIRIVAGPGDHFRPANVAVRAGETITFEVTAIGPVAHEFKVGPFDAVMADSEDVPEIANIGMMQTESLTYTFDGSGPYGFACHEPGHFEAGMWGTITIVT